MIISFFPCIFWGPNDGPNAWNFHGEASNFRGEATNFHGAMSNFRGAMSNFRGEATNFCGEATGGNQWPLLKTHILVTHRRSQEIIIQHLQHLRHLKIFQHFIGLGVVGVGYFWDNPMYIYKTYHYIRKTYMKNLGNLPKNHYLCSKTVK